MLKLFSNEVIDFRTNSAFATELVNIFQECIEKRESIQDVKTRIKEVPSFFAKTAVPKLKSAIKKYTGLTCDKVLLSKHLDLGFACLMNFGDKYGLTAADVINRYSGLQSDYLLQMYMASHHIKPVTASDMERIANSLDRETGLFGIDKINNNIPCTMNLYFDPYSAFLSKECGHGNFDYLLAPEIAAIVLHEIGHMVSTLAHSADRCFRIQVYNRAFEYFVQSATVVEKAKFTKTILSKLEDSKLSEQACKSIDQCTAVDNNTTTGSWVLNAFGIFLNLLLGLLTALGGSIMFLIDLAIVFPLDEIFDYKNMRFGIDGKLSDIGPSTKGAKLCEQFADEYVAKHGMGSWVVTGLRKIWDIGNTSGIGVFLTPNAGSLSYCVAKIPVIVNTLFLGDQTGGNGLYDRQSVRETHLMQELLKAFKSSSMSPEMVNFFIADYERCKKELTNKTSMIKYQNTMQLVRDAIRYLASTLPAMLFTGRFTREYEILINKIETLTSNSLFYRATKLDQLTKK